MRFDVDLSDLAIGEKHPNIYVKLTRDEQLDECAMLQAFQKT